MKKRQAKLSTGGPRWGGLEKVASWEEEIRVTSEMSGLWSGVGPAIHRQIRTRDVRGLGTGNKRNQRGDLINMPLAVERCDGLLRHCPIARGRIQIRVDRTRLDIVDRNAAAPDFSGQALGKHLDGSLGGRVGH
jgi:hypothetical protein